MDEYVIANKTDITSIADAIRSVTGTTDGMTLNQMATTIMEDVGSKSFVVTFTSNGNGTYSSDKTFAEIKDAIDAKSTVMCRYSSLVGYLSYHDDDEVMFYIINALSSKDVIFLINSQDVVVFAQFGKDNIIPKSVVTAKESNVVTVTSTYNNGIVTTHSITLDVNGYPASVTHGGSTCTLSWEGFE